MPRPPMISRLAALAAVLLVALGLGGCSGGGAGALSGTYEAKDGDGGLVLEFRGGNAVRVSMHDGESHSESMEARYEIEGSRVTIQPQGGLPMVLMRNGNALEGNVFGERLVFVRK